ncbi:MAG: hypothetical protein WCL21_18850 [Mariniphaga sp.]
MDRELIIQMVPNTELLKIFFQYATKELGAIKMNEVIDKVNSSNKVSRFLQEAKRVNQRLGTDDFLGCIHSSRSFVFAKAETISVASIALIMKWNHEAGKPLQISDDTYLNKRFFSVLDRCDGFKTHVFGNLNFFERFFEYLANLLSNEFAKTYIEDKFFL